MSEEAVATPDKMKVTELRKALSDRGLNTKGTKAVLVKQLFAAMQAEEGSNEHKEEEESTENEEKNEEEEKEGQNKEEEEKKKIEEEKSVEEVRKEEEKIEDENSKKEEEKIGEEEKKKEEEKLAEEEKKEEEKLAEEERKKEDEKEEEEQMVEEEEEMEGKEGVAVESEKSKHDEDADMKINEVEPEKSKDSESTGSKTEEENKVESKCGVKYTKVVRTVYVRQKDEDNKEEEDNKDDMAVEAKRGGTKRRMDDDENQEPNMKKRKVEKDEKEDEKKADADEKETVVVEVEPEIDETLMCLDWYNSDLNLKIGEDKISGQPEHKKGFGYAYAGARATHGFNSGKVWYEVKFTEALDCSLEKEGSRHDLRVGWSTDDASLQLGENEFSWCYVGATGKMANNSVFQDYGEKIEKDDVIGAYVDFEKESVSVSFTRNGEDLGEAYQIPKASLGGKALFPHILSKNVQFHVNFGSSEAWKECLPGDYTLATKIEHKIRGKPRIQKREDCELIMMVGLPASGKTTWVNKFIKENPYKNYNVLGTNAMLDKMTLEGKPRKEVHEGKWENLIRIVTNCNQDMIDLASKRRRNYIIDQTNVYANAQKKKAQPFVGLKRRAVVVVASTKEHKERIELQEKEGKKNFPNGIIEELKANLTLPTEKDTWFTEITFAELQREEAEAVVELDRKVAKEKGYGKKKEQRVKKNIGKGPVKGQKNIRASTGPRGQNQQRGMKRNGGQVMRPHHFRGHQNMGGSPMWNTYWHDKHHNNLKNMAQGAGWLPNRGNMGMMGAPNMGGWGNMGPQRNMGGQGNMGPQRNMGGQGNMGPQRNMGGQGNMGPQRNMGPQGNMGGQWRSGGFNQGGMQPNPFSQSWSQGGGWRR